ncbi:MAG TPA: amidohydrolase family protein [Nitrospira sp.]|nr:amidohydrolase family protein [Nitrospira sp.]
MTGLLAITRVRVIDGTGRVMDRASVVVRGDRIADVGASAVVRVPRGASIIDGRGMTLLPGLIDCHVHLCLGGEPDVVARVEQDDPSLTVLKAARYAKQTIEAGVTTVRDLGARDHAIFSLKRAIDEGVLPGPRIVAAGLAICTIGGHARFIGREVAGPDQVRTLAREQLAAGAGVIKVIASGGVLTPGTSPDEAQMTAEELSSAVEVARQAGATVAAHAHGASGMKNAARAGVNSIEHATLLDDDAAGLLKQHGCFIVPTLSALATTAASRRGCGIPDSALDKAKTMMKRHQRSFGAACRGGLPIAMGTDAGTPFNFHGDNAQELERMVALGMTPMKAILAATSSAARLLGMQEMIGTIERGRQADLVLITGNPLRKIEWLRDRDRIFGVMKGGRFVAGLLCEGSRGAEPAQRRS